ncbi:hypothetical protein ASG36_06970 [Geodermatophilus sp. Leaf369]|nr:hypothetical protein ASG36_06970 [Geodermatophilus sp. Leaf369]
MPNGVRRASCRATSRAAPIAIRCQATSSGSRSVRRSTASPATPEVPQASAAATTRAKPRAGVVTR